MTALTSASAAGEDAVDKIVHHAEILSTHLQDVRERMYRLCRKFYLRAATGE